MSNNKPPEQGIMEFCEDLIFGTGGLHSFEYHEMATPNCHRDVAVAAWVVRCLANPACAGSDGVLHAIMTRRAKVKAR